MRAAEELAKRQRESPLSSQGDRVRALFQSLPSLSDPEFEKIRVSSNLAVGEMNSRQPNAKSFHLPDGSHLITIYSGLVEFYDSVCRILFGAANMHSQGGVIEGLPLGDVVAQLEALFRTWTPQGIAEDKIADLQQTALQPDRQRFATILWQGALRFVLCHELGHVLYYRPSSSLVKPATLTKAQETASDIAGMKAAVMSAEDPGHARMSLAGCVVSLRVLAVFAALGHPFTGDHPDPLSRLTKLFEAMRTWCNSPGDYWSVSTIAYAFDEQLEAAGQRAAGGSDIVPVRPDRLFSRMCSMLEEVVNKNEREDDFAPKMQQEFEEASDEMLQQVAAYALEVFAKDSPARERTYQRWAEKGDFFLARYHEWPKRISDVFDTAFTLGAKAGA